MKPVGGANSSNGRGGGDGRGGGGNNDICSVATTKKDVNATSSYCDDDGDFEEWLRQTSNSIMAELNHSLSVIRGSETTSMNDLARRSNNVAHVPAAAEEKEEGENIKKQIGSSSSLYRGKEDKKKEKKKMMKEGFVVGRLEGNTKTWPHSSSKVDVEMHSPQPKSLGEHDNTTSKNENVSTTPTTTSSCNEPKKKHSNNSNGDDGGNGGGHFIIPMDLISRPFRSYMTQAILGIGTFSLNHRRTTLVSIVGISFVLCLLGVLLRFQFEWDWINSWCPQSNQFAGNICQLQKEFVASYGYPYEVFEIIVSSKTGNDIIDHLDRLYQVYEAINDVSIEYDDGIYTYEDLCFRGDTIYGEQTCMIYSPLDYFGIEYGPELLSAVINDTNPHLTLSQSDTRTIFGSLVRPDLYLSNITMAETQSMMNGMDSNTTAIQFASSASITFRLTSSPGIMRDIHRQWQLKVHDFLQDEFKLSEEWKISHRSTYTFDHEIAYTGIPAPLPIITTIVVMLVFMICTLGKHPRNSIQSRGWVGIGILLAVVPLALLSVKGFLLLIGQPFNMFTGTTAFFLVALGVDDVYVFVHEFDSHYDHDFVQNATNEQLRDAILDALKTVGMAVTFTSFTDIAVFLLGMLSPFDSMRVFFLDLGLTMLALWFMFIALAPVFLYWDLIRQRENISVLSVRKILQHLRNQSSSDTTMTNNPKVLSESTSRTTESASSEEEIVATEVDSGTTKDIAYHIGKAMENVYLQLLIMISFIAVLAICSYNIPNLEEKTTLDGFQNKGSYVEKYYADAQTLYGGFSDPIDIVFTNMTNIHEQEVQKERDLFYSIIENKGSVDFIFVKSKSKLVKIKTSDIYFVEALKDYVVINTLDTRYTIHSTMKDMEAKLSWEEFIRVHRSFIVRIDKIVAIEYPNLQLENDKKEVPIGGSYKEDLLRRLNLI